MDIKQRNELEQLCIRMYGGVCLIDLLHEALLKGLHSADSYADAVFAVYDYMNELVMEMKALLSPEHTA